MIFFVYKVSKRQKKLAFRCPILLTVLVCTLYSFSFFKVFWITLLFKSSQIQEMESQINHISQTVHIHKEKVRFCLQGRIQGLIRGRGVVTLPLLHLHRKILKHFFIFVWLNMNFYNFANWLFVDCGFSKKSDLRISTAGKHNKYKN